MYVNCIAKEEDNYDAMSRRLRVLLQLREYNDPQLWGSVSPLILDHGKLVLNFVITSADVAMLEWCLTSCVGKDLRGLL